MPNSTHCWATRSSPTGAGGADNVSVAERAPATRRRFELIIGLRGNLDEGEPAGSPGTYLNSFYEVRPLPYSESAYGNPEAGETMINVTKGKVFRLLVDDEPFDVQYGKLVRHERTLDLRDGVLR